MNFLDKEFVHSFFISDYNADREDQKEVRINGRRYIKFGTRTAICVVANLYKLTTPSNNQFRYVALLGLSRQHPCDSKINKEQGIEIAAENANTNPVGMLYFDHEVTYYEIKDIMMSYANTFEKQFVKTHAELVAEGKTDDLKSKKYMR